MADSPELNSAFEKQSRNLSILYEIALAVGAERAREGGESHFHVTAVSQRFAGLNRVARQRLVYGALADELAGPIHALSLTLRAPDEA